MAAIPVSMSVPMSEVMKDMTLNIEVTGKLRAAVRIRAGVWIMRLAARVMGVGASCVVVEMTPPLRDHA
ncbi:hypothetical protein PMI02_04892 [Novosphingobium sp. AP12]|nr:hypothetical protein PMI02_04892 [Novosphingobium sp. AP12]